MKKMEILKQIENDAMIEESLRNVFKFISSYNLLILDIILGNIKQHLIDGNDLLIQKIRKQCT